MASIFLKTGNLNNKGDMLMLLAILQRYGDKHQISVLPSSCSKSTAENLGLLFCRPYLTSSKKTPLALFKNLVMGFLIILPDIILKRLGYVSPRNISLVLDASGYAYGEVWGPKKVINSVKMYSCFKGAHVVFMPQSYGPFESQALQGRVRDLIHNSPMVCARDRSSYNHIASLVSGSPNVYCSPDFTFDVAKKEPAALSLPEKYVVFIPSHRVAESIGHEAFWCFYRNAFKAATKCHYKVVVLAHDVKHDFDLGEKLRKSLGMEKATVALDDVREIRWVISKSSLVVGSRFHGLVSALSQCVPAVGLGWTHKFDCLFEDYGIGEFLVKDEIGLAGVPDMVRRLLDVEGKGERKAFLAAVRNNRKVLRDRANFMWERLDDIVDKA